MDVIGAGLLSHFGGESLFTSARKQGRSHHLNEGKTPSIKLFYVTEAGKLTTNCFQSRSNRDQVPLGFARAVALASRGSSGQKCLG